LAAPVLLWFSLRGVAVGGIWSVLREMSPWRLAGLGVLNLAVLLLLALRWQVILRSMGARVPLPRVLAYRLAGFGLSYLTPGPQIGGEPLQVLLLRRREGIASASAVASVMLDKLFELMANFAFLLAGFNTAALNGTLPAGLGLPAWLAIIPLAAPAAYLILLWRGHKPFRWLGLRIGQKNAGRRLELVTQAVCEAEELGGGFCRKRPLLLAQVAAISIIIWIFAIFEFHWLLEMLGAALPLAQLVSLLTALRLAFLLPVPGGLGTMETALVLAGQAVGLSPIFALSAALIIRARDITLALIGIWLGGYSLQTARSLSPTPREGEN
jgi:uncharacterized protein (TIRG00374 family)